MNINEEMATSHAEEYVRMKINEFISLVESNPEEENPYPSLYRVVKDNAFARKRAERILAKTLIHIMPSIFHTELVVVGPSAVLAVLEYGFAISNEYAQLLEEQDARTS